MAQVTQWLNRRGHVREISKISPRVGVTAMGSMEVTSHRR